ncbi:sulfatase-like hydrolase/transferase [Tistrella sp. BH-R2-4]|uniref:Sulfatase-like hydrolase/transferase n=1 Tax=Tistrella arctica TaxID=3133430 RepID=A0ABU9YH16_9PROT
MSRHRPARNVLLIVVDQWRWDLSPGLGLPHVATPALDALAARGAVFTRHFAQSVPCGPARATMATGQYPFTHRVFSNPVPLSAHHRQLQHHLRDAGVTPWMIGYTTSVPDPRGRNPADPAFTGPSVAEGWRVVREMAEDKSNYMAWARNRQGEPGPAPHAPDDYDTAFANHLRAGAPVEASPQTDGLHDSRWLADAAVDVISQQQHAPWLLHLGLFRPHPPLAALARHLARIPGAPPLAKVEAMAEDAIHPLAALLRAVVPASIAHPGLDGRAADLPPETVAALRHAYLALLAEVDDEIARVLAALRRHGRDQDTLVIFMSDHGEQWGEHGLFGKRALHQASFRVPMIIADPRATADPTRGSRIAHITEHVDLLPTVLDWFGIAPPPQCAGRSLLPLLAGDTPEDWRTAAVYEHDFRDKIPAFPAPGLARDPHGAHFCAIQDEAFAYLHFPDADPVLFDLATDPAQTRNVATDPAYAPVVATMMRRLLDHRMRHADRTLTEARATPAGLAGRW